MGPVCRKIAGDLQRRRPHALAIGTVLAVASMTATLALEVLVGSMAPFDQAFASAKGAHVVVEYAPETSRAALDASGHVTGVTGVAGPWPVAQAGIGTPDGDVFTFEAVSSRPSASGDIDVIAMSAGRWWRTSSEAVVDPETARQLDIAVGDRVAVFAAPSDPAGEGAGGEVSDRPVASLTVVGLAHSVSTPAVGLWASPSVVSAVAGSSHPNLEMLYRVDPSANHDELEAAIGRITATVPAIAVRHSTTYLDAKQTVDRVAELYAPVLLAFSIFALAAVAFTITNVVSGVVLSERRDIGVMKAIGYTPVQVAQVLVGNVAVPMFFGVLLGTGAGSLVSLPMHANLTRSLGLPLTSSFSIPAALGSAATAAAFAILAALGPAIGAARLTPVAALSGDRAAPPAIEQIFRHLGLRLRSPIPIRLGITTLASHPGRATMTLGALLMGVTGMTFALGLNLSLTRIMDDLNRTTASPVRVVLGDGSSEAVDGTIHQTPGSARIVSVADTDVIVPGLGTVVLAGYEGDASWLGYALIDGRWFTGPGEAVAPATFFAASGLHVGDATTLYAGNRSIGIRLVGETFEVASDHGNGLVLRGSWRDAQTLEPRAMFDRWEVQPGPQVDVDAYVHTLTSALDARAEVTEARRSQSDASFLLFLLIVTVLGAGLVTLAVVGVFNTILLETRQRSRELAILKTLGLTPRQTVGLVLSSILPLGLVAGVFGVPLGVAAQQQVLQFMGQLAAQTPVPGASLDVYGPLLLVGLGLSGVLIAAAGAYPPAARIGRSPVAARLQTE